MTEKTYTAADAIHSIMYAAVAQSYVTNDRLTWLAGIFEDAAESHGGLPDVEAAFLAAAKRTRGVADTRTSNGRPTKLGASVLRGIGGDGATNRKPSLRIVCTES